MAEYVESKRPKYTYFDFKAGRCSDLDYFKSAYGGTVTKHYSRKDIYQEHPFFVINRKIKEGPYKYYEVKVYDLTRGLIEKTKVWDKIDNKIFWEGDDDNLGYSDSSYFKTYVQYLIDTHVIKRSKKSSK